MALGSIPAHSKKETILKELASGLFTGTMFGIFCGLIVYVLDLLGGGGFLGTSPAAVGAIIGFGLLGSCLAGTLLGIFSPLFFSRIGVDPAVSAGPIVTAFNDFLSMSIFFLISWGIRALFL